MKATERAIRMRTVHAHRALTRFLHLNRCPHCNGVADHVWALALVFIREEGTGVIYENDHTEAVRPTFCPGHDQPARWTADQLEAILHEARRPPAPRREPATHATGEVA